MTSKSVFMFPGQGSQYAGMYNLLNRNIKAVAELIESVKAECSVQFIDKYINGTDDDLKHTEIAQPAIVLTSIGCYLTIMENKNPWPAYMVGHSLGEITALACSGAINYVDAIKIAQIRGTLMQRECEKINGGMMAVIGSDLAFIENYCHEKQSKDEQVYIANKNTNNQIVLAGCKDALQRCSSEFKEKGLTCIELKVNGAFHSPLMQGAVDEFRKELMAFTFNKTAVPVLSSINGRCYSASDSIVDLLAEQLVSPVQWNSCIRFLELQNIIDAYEIGPGKVLSMMVAKASQILKGIPYKLNAEKNKAFEQVLDVKKFVGRTCGIAVSVPNNNFNDEEYRNNVIETYQILSGLYQDLKEKKVECSNSTAIHAFELLKKILKGKQISTDEYYKRINCLLEETQTEEILAGKTEWHI